MVETKSKLVVFLYKLMRDDVVPGIVEKLVQDVESAIKNDGENLVHVFSNDHLANYAKELSVRLGDNA